MLMVGSAAADYTMFNADVLRTGQATDTGPQSDNIKWTTTLQECPGSSPVVYNNMVFVGTQEDMDWDDHYEKKLKCLNSKTGEEIWSYSFGTDTNKGVSSGTAIADEKIFFGGKDGYLYAINIDDGSEAWKVQLDASGNYYGITSTPLVYENKLYALSSPDGILHAFDLDGNEEWSIDNGNWGTGAYDTCYFTSPSAKDDIIYFPAKNNTIFAYDVNTQDEIWNFSAEGAIRSSPVIGTELVVWQALPLPTANYT